MHRVDAPGHVDNEYSDGNPAIGQQATQVRAAHLNDIQENICAVIEAAAIALVKGDGGQLLAAILGLIDSGALTAAEILALLVTVDGAGSGLDSDLLDGQSGAYYADIVARLGYTPQNAAGYTAADVLAKLLTVDGAGSAIDADLLDGFQAAAFLRDVGSSLAEPGYFTLSNGLIYQWGTVTGTFTSGVDNQINFPLTFPTECLLVTAGNGDVQAQAGAVIGPNYTTPPNASRFFWRTNVTGQNRCNWIAIGK